eukprot:GFKZ01002649.1.p1 GENE.GFKZ01002649.1~~GFKZ01002649.1.p1  ORF type:complete len:735 (+),score=83.88 GFKZ01002649.1:52-2256(+)
MWRLNVERGRQWWTFNPAETPPDGFDKALKQARSAYTENRFTRQHSSDKILRLLASYDLLNNGTEGRLKPVPETLKNPVDRVLHKAVAYYSTLQTGDGHWAGDYGGPMFLLPGMVIAMYVANMPFEGETRKELVRYLKNHQNSDGGFGLHIEHKSTMFGSAMNYVAMRLLGVASDDDACVKGREWILRNGGAGGIPGWGKFWLAVLGVYEWDGLDPLTPEFWLMPYWVPCHPARFWCHCRVVYLPMSHLYGKRATGEITALVKELRNELYDEAYDTIQWNTFKGMCCEEDVYVKRPRLQRVLWGAVDLFERLWFPGKAWLRNRALEETLALVRNEDENTNHIDIGPVNKVINFLCIWFDDPRSERVGLHADRMKDYLWLAEDGMRMQGYNGSQLWDTAFSSQALMSVPREVLKPFVDMLTMAHHYLEITQVLVDVPDRERWYRHQSKGAWPFSTRDHGWPISDCTGEGLAAALELQSKEGTWIPKRNMISLERLEDAVRMILSYQNDDGGWATYENRRAGAWLEFMNPSEVFADIMVDYSYVECSASSMKGIAAFRNEYPDHPLIPQINTSLERGKKYIESIQREDGSWYGSWGVCFLYAAWFAVDVFTSMGETLETSSCMRRACEFILSKQKEDGSWGESYLSSETKTYVNSETGLVVSTGFALVSLTMAKWPDKEPLQRAADFLMREQEESGDWPQQSISGVFNKNCMISYSQYRNIFPIFALGIYRRNYLS